MGREGFEPPKAEANRFTVCPLWPLGYLPLLRRENIKGMMLEKGAALSFQQSAFTIGVWLKAASRGNIKGTWPEKVAAVSFPFSALSSGG